MAETDFKIEQEQQERKESLKQKANLQQQRLE